MSEENPTNQKKKSRGAGQIVERGPDKYLIRVFLGRDSAGKRHYHDETFHGKKRQAQDRLRALLTKHKAGESLKIGRDTLDTFLDEWVSSLTDLKESTTLHYKKLLEFYIRPKLGNLMLSKVEAGDVQKLYESLAESGLSRSTITYVHTLLKSTFKLALRRRKIAFNPMDGVDAPDGKRMEEEQKEARDARVLTADQVAKFLAAAAATRFDSLFTLAFHTGCRPGELLGLKWEMFDAKAQTLRILKTIKWPAKPAPGKPAWYLDTPKTANGRRVLRLTAGLVEMLAAHRKRQLEERMKAGRAWQDHGFIFTNEIGEPYRQQALYYQCKRILKTASLPGHFNPYSARHTSATLLMAGGINPKTVSDRLGHADVNITLKTYTHPTADMQMLASEEIERVIQGSK
ncbi:MAG: tyrosine-type recombinase/integrase [Acidobacteriota bacterium]